MQNSVKLRSIIKTREDRNDGGPEMSRNGTNLSIEAGESSFMQNVEGGGKPVNTLGQPRRLG